MPWRSLLVLGGIGSGHAGYAETLLTGAAPSPQAGAIPAEPAAATAEPVRIAAQPGGDLAELAGALGAGKPDQTLLIDLAGWLRPDPTDPAAPASDRVSDGLADAAGLADLIAAVRACPSRLVLVSAEVGLQTMPATAAARRLAEALGRFNRTVAELVDAVVLVVAGQPSWLKGAPAGTGPAGAAPPLVTAPPLATDSTPPDLSDLPSPDDTARTAAAAALERLGPVSLGALAEVVRFAAGCQGTPIPRPWQQVRVMALAVTDSPAAVALRAGQGPLADLATGASARLELVETAAAGPLADGPAMPDPDVEAALRRGWALAGRAVDEGDDLLVLAGLEPELEAAAAAVTTMLVPGSEPAGLLGWVRTDQGTIDDRAWIARCAAARDAVRRARAAGRGTGRAVLAELGGPLLATAAGLLLGAAARRTPVLLDGPVGAAAALVARNLAPVARNWWLLPDTGGHPLVQQAAGPLGQQPLLDLRLRMGEGTTALTALPLLQRALSLAGRHAADPAGSAG